MEANTRQLEAIFDPNVFFQVPLFQRPYVWTEAENWEPLWEDIQTLLDRQLTTGKARAHFLGAIVLEQVPHPAGSMEHRHRRAATFHNAAAVLDGRAQSGRGPWLDQVRRPVHGPGGERLVARRGQRSSNFGRRTATARPETIHACKSLKDVEQAAKIKPGLADNNLVGAYKFFHKELAKWLKGELDDPEDEKALAGKTIDDRLDALWLVVKTGLQLVVINLGLEDETQVIFETLNARGTDLLPADLIKNYPVRKARVGKTDEEMESLYDEHWARFETDFWRKEVQQGRIKRPRIDLFVNHYLTLMMRDEVRSTHLFSAFKSFVESEGENVPTDAAGHIEQLAQYADVFRQFYEPGSHVALARFLKLLDAVDTATVFPFLLFAYAELMPDDKAEFDKVLAVLESFLMRRLITNWTTKNYNRLFVDLIKAVETSLNAKAVAEHLAKGAGESSKFPGDAELATFVYEQPLYGRIAQRKVRGVLEALEEASQSKKSPVLELTEKLTIEHVMPQTWQPFWPLPASATIDPAIEQRAIHQREVMLNTLGNLTLITGSFNSSLQNAAWPSKRPELLTYGKINLTQYFHGPAANEWAEAAIRQRTEHLFHLLVKIWPDANAVA